MDKRDLKLEAINIYLKHIEVILLRDLHSDQVREPVLECITYIKKTLEELK